MFYSCTSVGFHDDGPGVLRRLAVRLGLSAAALAPALVGGVASPGIAAARTTPQVAAAATAPTATVFLDTQNEVLTSSLAVDAAGGRQVVFSRGASASYKQCTAGLNCDDPGSWSAETPLVIGVHHIQYPPQLQLTPDGLPRVLFTVGDANGTTFFLYGSCDVGCGSDANWTILDLSSLFSVPRDFTSDVRKPAHFFALDPLGRPRFVFSPVVGSLGLDGLTYAFCDTGCAASPTNWSSTRLTPTVLANDFRLHYTYPSLAFTSTGGPRVIGYAEEKNSVFDPGIAYLGYLECDGSCDSVASWSFTNLVGTPGDAFRSALVRVDRADVVHMTQYQNGSLSYNSCLAVCTTNAGENWFGSLVGTVNGDGQDPDLRFDSQNLPQLVFHAGGGLGTGLGSATCTAQCNGVGATWSSQLIDGGNSLTYQAVGTRSCDGTPGVWLTGNLPSLVLDSTDGFHISATAQHFWSCGGQTASDLTTVVVDHFAPPPPVGTV